MQEIFKQTGCRVILVGAFAIFASTGLAQELDDIEVDMDTAISESEAARSAEDYASKRNAEEEQKLRQAEQAAAEAAEKAKKVKASATARMKDLDRETAAFITERKIFDTRTRKLNAQIAKDEEKVRQAEEKLNQAKLEKRQAVEHLEAAKKLLEQRRAHLAQLEAQKKQLQVETMKAKRDLASVAAQTPGQSIKMAKTCGVYGEMSSSSSRIGEVRKGEKVSLARVSPDGWFFVKKSGLKGFLHKDCN